MTATFHEIDEAQKRANVVHAQFVNSTPAHVQGTSAIVKEPVGHVQSMPNTVIDLVSEESKGWKLELVQEYIERAVEERMRKFTAEIRLEKDQSADMIPESTDESSLAWMTSATTSSVPKKPARLSPEAVQ